MMLYIFAIFLAFSTSLASAQSISNQGWQNQTVSSDTITIDCAELLLPFELGRLIVENNPTTERGEMDKSLRSGHAAKVSLQPESGTSDTISNITGCSTNGARVQLATVDTGDTITVAHTPGVIEFAGGANVLLDSPLKILTLQRKAGIWVSDGGLGDSSGSSGDVLEDLTTACATGQVGVSNGGGGVDCAYVVPQRTDCSGIVTLGAFCVDSDDGRFYAGDGTAAVHMGIINVAEECTAYAGLGQLCVDSDNGILFAGDGSTAGAVGTGGGGSSSLDQAFDLGKTIDGATSEPNALVVGNGTDGFRFFVGSGGPTMKCFQGANACDITIDIPATKAFKIKYEGTDGLSIDSTGNVTLANNMIMWRSFWFGAGALSTDGSQCANPEERQINGGLKTWVIQCADNNASTIYGTAGMPDGYNGGTINFEIQAVNENAAPSGNLSISFAAMCRGDGNALNSAFGTPVATTTAFTTQYNLEHSNTVTVTPNGTCDAGELISWRATWNETATTTQAATMYIIGIKMEYPTSDWSDN